MGKRNRKHLPVKGVSKGKTVRPIPRHARGDAMATEWHHWQRAQARKANERKKKDEMRAIVSGRGLPIADDFRKQPKVPMLDVTTLPDERQRMFLYALAISGGNVAQACRDIGITRETFYEWVRNDKPFHVAATEIRAALVDLVENAHMRSALAGNVMAQMSYLRTKRPDEWVGEQSRPLGVDKDQALRDAVDDLRATGKLAPAESVPAGPSSPVARRTPKRRRTN